MKEIYQCVLLITSYKMSSASFKNFQQEANDRSIRDYGLDFAELPVRTHNGRHPYTSLVFIRL